MFSVYFHFPTKIHTFEQENRAILADVDNSIRYVTLWFPFAGFRDGMSFRVYVHPFLYWKGFSS